jgi:hypothetical protein
VSDGKLHSRHLLFSENYAESHFGAAVDFVRLRWRNISTCSW